MSEERSAWLRFDGETLLNFLMVNYPGVSEQAGRDIIDRLVECQNFVSDHLSARMKAADESGRSGYRCPHITQRLGDGYEGRMCPECALTVSEKFHRKNESMAQVMFLSAWLWTMRPHTMTIKRFMEFFGQDGVKETIEGGEGGDVGKGGGVLQ